MSFPRLWVTSFFPLPPCPKCGGPLRIIEGKHEAAERLVECSRVCGARFRAKLALPT